MSVVVAIVGPTGSGKTSLAIHLALAFDGEIVGADSRQVYRYMDIGTAKPSAKELALVPHHLISCINPDEEFGLAQYQKMAYRTIKDIQTRNKLPFLVGGTGQYIWAVLEGWEIPKVAPKPELRQSLEAKAEKKGSDFLYQELRAIDPAAAQKIDPRNVRRVIRALEVYYATKTPFSQLKRKGQPPFKTLIIGLTADRDELYRHVDARVDNMIKQGLIEETQKLLDTGYSPDLPSMSSIGYRQIVKHIIGELSLADAIQQIKFETHRYIRQQYAWFKLSDKRIHWSDMKASIEPEIRNLIAGFLKG